MCNLCRLKCFNLTHVTTPVLHPQTLSEENIHIIISRYNSENCKNMKKVLIDQIPIRLSRNNSQARVVLRIEKFNAGRLFSLYNL